MNLITELQSIGNLLTEACTLEMIKKEVTKALHGHKAMVISGELAEKHLKNSSEYDIVVVHHESGKKAKLLARRIKSSVPEALVSEFGGIIDGIIGIKTSRRMK